MKKKIRNKKILGNIFLEFMGKFLWNSLGILWEFFGILGGFFGNSLEILWEFFGNSFRILWESFEILLELHYKYLNMKGIDVFVMG